MSYKTFLHEEFIRAFYAGDFERMDEIQCIEYALGYIPFKIL